MTILKACAIAASLAVATLVAPVANANDAFRPTPFLGALQAAEDAKWESRGHGYKDGARQVRRYGHSRRFDRNRGFRRGYGGHRAFKITRGGRGFIKKKRAFGGGRILLGRGFYLNR